MKKKIIMSLLICALLATISGIVMAAALNSDKNNNGVDGDENYVVSAPVSKPDTGVAVSTETIVFPSISDTYVVQTYPWWWHVGDQVYGSRYLTLSSVNQVDMYLAVTNNALSGTGHVDQTLTINGIAVGSWTIYPGDTVIAQTFTFSSINGPLYDIKIEETNLVDSGMGSVTIDPDWSTMTFYQPTVYKYCFQVSPFIDVLKVNMDSGVLHGQDVVEGYYSAPVLGKVISGKYEFAIDFPEMGGYSMAYLDGSVSTKNGVMWRTFTGDDLVGPTSIKLVPRSCTAVAPLEGKKLADKE